jgi:hypothetical protein
MPFTTAFEHKTTYVGVSQVNLDKKLEATKLKAQKYLLTQNKLTNSSAGTQLARSWLLFCC